MSKNNSNAGRKKTFKSPNVLWGACLDYFEWCANNPKYLNDFVRSGKGAGEIVQIPSQRPYTIQGLCNYLNISIQTFYNYKEYGTEFLEVITQVEQIIQQNQLEGAMIGGYNSNIVARLLGLTDKQDVTLGGKQGENTEPIQIEVIHTNQNFEDNGSNSPK